MNKDVMFSSKTDEWETPQYFFDDINKEFYFDFDACASAENAKCKRYCTKEQDGLVQKWGGGADLVQPSVWSRNRKMGKESIRRVA